MQFTPEHIQKIINKILGIVPGKNETRRVHKPAEYGGVGGFVTRGEYAVGKDGAVIVLASGTHVRNEPIHTVLSITARGDRIKWQVGRDYAVSPGRGKPGVWWNPETGEWALPDLIGTGKGDGKRVRAVIDYDYPNGDPDYTPLRILVLSISHEPLQDISEADAVAEGCDPGTCPTCKYWNEWSCACGYCDSAKSLYRDDWCKINGPKSWERDCEKYVWALTFEVVR